jgi:hypothetical protein
MTSASAPGRSSGQSSLSEKPLSKSIPPSASWRKGQVRVAGRRSAFLPSAA